MASLSHPIGVLLHTLLVVDVVDGANARRGTLLMPSTASHCQPTVILPSFLVPPSFLIAAVVFVVVVVLVLVVVVVVMLL